MATSPFEEKRKNPAERLIDVYQGRLPNDIKDVFKVAKALIVGNEIVAPVIGKLAETPITNIVVKTKGDNPDSDAEEKLRKIITEDLKMHDHLKSVSFNMYGYSNAFSSVYFAPKRYLECPLCKNKKDRAKGDKFKWLASKLEWTTKTYTDKTITGDMTMNNIDFYGNCPNGHKNVRFVRRDIVYRNTKSLRIIAWDPFNIEIVHYRAIGRNEYYYRFEKEEKNRIMSGDRVVLCEYPWPYILACINGRLLNIKQSGFWHFKLMSVSGVYDGWGVPKILSILTALYTVMSMMKANESISEGRINDLTIISPTPSRNVNREEDPVNTFSLNNWLSQTKSIIEKFKKDKTLTAFLPFPVTAESIYGQGRMQLVTGELSLYIRNIVTALGLPEDVVFSGGNYTSIAVAARILSNQAENARKNYNNFLNFIKDTISKSLTDADFSNQVIELQPYESSDDFQKTNLMIQAAMAGKFPWGPIYKRFGFNSKEIKIMMNDEAEMFGEIMKKMAKAEGRSTASIGAIQQYFQMQAANEMAKWNALQQSVDMKNAEQAKDFSTKKRAAVSLAQSILSNYPPDMWSVVIEDISSKDPELAGMIAALMKEYEGGAGSQQATQMIGGGDEQVGEMDTGLEVQGGAKAVANVGTEFQAPDKRPPRSEKKL